MKTSEKRGFTLLELTVVIAVIGLLTMTALPSIMGMFRSGSDAQAYNVVAAMLTSARAEAMRSGHYVAVHFERAVITVAPETPDPTNVPHPECTLIYNADNQDSYWCAVMIYAPAKPTTPGGNIIDPNTGRFVPHPDYPPRRLPGHMAIGEVRETSGPFFGVVSGTAYNLGSITSNDLSDKDYRDFTTFTVLFAPNGMVVRTFSDSYITFANTLTKNSTGELDASNSQILFWQNLDSYGTNPTDAKNKLEQSAIWKERDDSMSPHSVECQKEPGATAMVLFDALKLRNCPTAADRTKYMNENGQIIAINQYTGQLFPRK